MMIDSTRHQTVIISDASSANRCSSPPKAENLVLVSLESNTSFNEMSTSPVLLCNIETNTSSNSHTQFEDQTALPYTDMTADNRSEPTSLTAQQEHHSIPLDMDSAVTHPALTTIEQRLRHEADNQNLCDDINDVDHNIHANEEEDDDGDELDEDNAEDEEEDDEDDCDEDDDDNEDDEDEDDDSEDDSEGIVDPGRHTDNVHHTSADVNDLIGEGDLCADLIENDILDGERMLEVTRKLVRSTERDPDRDLRKQVLLKTAIKKLPNFMDYNHYSVSFPGNMSQQAYYESHHESQPKFQHSVQPNAIQMSTTSLRMLDLNDDHDPELGNLEPENLEPNLAYSHHHRTSLVQQDYVSQQHYDRYHQRTSDLNHYDTSSGSMIARHNSLDNLYQPLNGSDISEEISKEERIPIAFQIACEIYDFTCTTDDSDRKLLDNFANGYYTRTTKDFKSGTSDGCDDETEAQDRDGSEGSSSSNSSSSSDDSTNSLVSQSAESDGTNGASLLEASLNSSSDFYHSSHDSGVVLFGSKSNKRSSSSIGLDDDMDIDQLTELSTCSYKKLRKRDIIE